MDFSKIEKIVVQEAEKFNELLGVGADVSVVVEEGDEGIAVAKVTFDGQDLGYMIGNRGRHLMGLQYILSTIVRNKVKAEDENQRVAILVDVAGYRQQRIEKIEKLAMQKADDARILGEPVDLMPMSASDRRVVHTVLGKFDDITTESFGEDFERYVRIVPKSEKELGVVSEIKDDGEESEEEQE